MNHPTTYAEIMRKIEEYTEGLRYFRTLPDYTKHKRGEVVLERYINLLSAKARAQSPIGRRGDQNPNARWIARR